MALLSKRMPLVLMSVLAVVAAAHAQGYDYLPPNKGYNYPQPSVPFPTTNTAVKAQYAPPKPSYRPPPPPPPTTARPVYRPPPPPPPPTVRPVVYTAPPTARPIVYTAPPTARPVVYTAPQTARPVVYTAPQTVRPVVYTAPQTARPIVYTAPPTARPVVYTAPQTARPIVYTAPPTARPIVYTAPPTAAPRIIARPPPPPPAPVVHQQEHHDHEHHHEPGMPFDFAYAVNEDGNDYSHNAVSDGDVTKGEYRILLPDGRTQVVKYTADWKEGFNAQVTYEGQARFPDQPNGVFAGGSSGYKY